LGGLVSDEKRPLQYPCNKLNDLSCPSCGRREFYFISRQRLGCAKCGCDFRPSNGTSFSIIKLFAPKWLSLVKSFELSVSARRASLEVNLSYNTALKAFDAIRLPILRDSMTYEAELKGERELDESYFGDKRKGSRG
jgi:transposase